MTFSFRPATRDKIGLLFGLAGASGSGKTFSALRLAKGLANGGGTMTMIDTEAGRAKHYADRFNFLHCDFAPPFSPMRYVEAVRAAEEAGGTVNLIDSMSHEWAGEGGCSDMQQREAERMATYNGEINYNRMEALTGPAWKRPKIEHKRMMARLLQSRSHLIFCLRAEEKVKFIKEKDERTGKEKQVIVPAGFQPICEKGFMFEMSGFITLHPETPGMVRYDLPHKLNDDLQAIFPDGSMITEECGARLRVWAETGADTRVSPQEQKIIDAVRDLVERIEDASSRAALDAILDEPNTAKQRDWLGGNRLAMSKQVEAAIDEAVARTAVAEDVAAD